MNTKLIQLTLAGVLALASLSGAWAADDKEHAKKKPSEPLTDLRQELTSPAGGEFSAAGEILRSGTQQEFGGLSGNTNGMDSMPTATGEASAFPSTDTSLPPLY